MSKYTALTDELHAYVIERGVRQDELLARLERETAELAGEMSAMQVSPDEGALLTVLAAAIGARRALEIGTFTGYSSICIARGFAEGGTLLSCEVSEEWAAVARRYFAAAGLDDRIEVRLGPALETLRALPSGEPFDLAFIDADKPSYPDYWEECLRLVRPGGLVLVDNVFAGGGVVAGAEGAGGSFGEESVAAIRAVNDAIAEDSRVDVAMVAIADGLTIARRRAG